MSVKYSGDTTLNKILELLKALIAGKENSSNKVTAIGEGADDTQYPSAKATNTAISEAISAQTSETWTFTLADGSSVTKTVVLK